MSENTQPTPQNDEVDLGQVFSYIEKLFKKIGEFISEIFKFFLFALKKLVVFFLFSINIVISKIIPISIAIVLGLALSFGLSNVFKSYYNSEMIIQQNFKTGNIVYSQINSLKALALQSDSMALSKALNIKPNVASQIINFSINPIVDNNNLRIEHNDFVKNTDSVYRISFEEYVDNKNLENSSIQIISVDAKTPNALDGLEDPIIESILDNEYLNELKEKEIRAINRKKETLLEVLSKSDTLQENYFKLLEKYYKVETGRYNSSSTDINFNLDSKSKDKVSTKEYDLFIQSINLKEELDKVESTLAEKNEIITLQKGFTSADFKEKAFYESRLFLPLLFASVVFLFFLLRELNFGGTIGKYGTKEELFKSDK